ncbi:hypothetical protein F5880DRAFT_1512291, partial [Lentinula raphanica]
MSSPVGSAMPPAPTNTPLDSPPPYPDDEDNLLVLTLNHSTEIPDLCSAVRTTILGIVQDPRLMGSDFDPSRLPVNVLDGILSNIVAFNTELNCVEQYASNCTVKSKIVFTLNMVREVEDNRQYIDRLEDDFNVTEMELVDLRSTQKHQISAHKRPKLVVI